MEFMSSRLFPSQRLFGSDSQDEASDLPPKFTDEELVSIVQRFVHQRVSEINQDSLPDRELVFPKKVPASGELDGDWIDRCAYDILMQLMYISYLELSGKYLSGKTPTSATRAELPTSVILAPETPDLLEEKPKAMRNTVKVIPETLAFTQNLLNNKNESQSEDDEDIPSDSPSLLSRPNVRKGLLKAPMTTLPPEKEAKVSPPIKKKKESPSNFFEDDDEDFKDFSPAKNVASTSGGLAQPSKKAKAMKITNKFGISVDPPSLSQAEKLKARKQQKVSSYFSGNQKSKSSESDMQKALRISKETADKEESIRRRKILAELDDSFDKLPEKEPKLPDLGYKYAHPTVRKKEDRKELQGFECADCIGWFEGEDMTEEEIRAKIQKCSKHRAKFAPRRSRSPQDMWKIGIESDEEKERTQIGPPLRTRRRKKLP